MHIDLSGLVWSSSRELVEALARYAKMETNAVDGPGAGAGIECACARLGLEAERVDLVGHRVAEQLRESVPAVLPVAGLYLGLAGWRGDALLVLAPDVSLRPVPVETLRDIVCADAEAAYSGRVVQLLDKCAIPASGRQRARRALLEEQTRSRRVGIVWQLRARPGSCFLSQVRSSGLTSRLLLLCGAHVFEYSLWLLAWYVLGRSALDGRMDAGMLIAWCLLLVTIVPVRMMTTWSQGMVGLGLGGLLKQRLLSGALQLDNEHVRSQGVGQALGQVIESDSVEAAMLSGGLAAALAAFELALSAIVLALGAGGWLQVVLLAGWICVSGFLAWAYARKRWRWTEWRLQMTHDLVERKAGHRTRLAQSPSGEWHADQDEALDRYFESSIGLDRWHTLLLVVVPRGWLIFGLAGLLPVFLSSASVNPASTAVGLGGVLLAYRAFKRLAAGVPHLVGAGISWKKVAPLFQAASRTEPVGSGDVSVVPPAATVLLAQDLQFAYRDRARPVLRDVSFRVSKGDWILLEGGSGGGKSTLASLVSGLREPQSGLLLSGGLDRQTLGARGWRKRTALAPQYHENYILAETLAFNLLMGRYWPPRSEDLAEAEAVCRELGLGELLERMSAGLQQMVGETGWQLSQGEKSRIFLARALLQGSDLIVLVCWFSLKWREGALR
jgi:ATP-binding cassette, subfamily B, bacterial